MKSKKIFKGIIFVLVFLIGFFSLQSLLVGDDDLRDPRRIRGFFAERENSLDAVFIGPSTTYTFWAAPLAWNEYGITVYPLSNAMQPLAATEFLIKDAIKKQPDALYIVNITTVLDKYDIKLHRLTDNYPLTVNKFPMINYICNRFELSLSERMEYYFPIIRFHERWNVLNSYDFNSGPDSFKGAGRYKEFLELRTDVSDGKVKGEEYIPLSDKLNRTINDIMDYCEEEKIKVLFVAMPLCLTNQERLGKMNTMVDIVKDRGFDVLDMRDYVEEINLDFTSDLYDNEHANIHGCIKVTDFFARYLVENYGFEDKRDNEDYSDWDLAFDKYYKRVKDFLTENDLSYLTVEETYENMQADTDEETETEIENPTEETTADQE